MDNLSKIFNVHDYSIYNKKFEQRISFDSVVKLNLSIKPMDQPTIHTLYYIPTNSIIKKTQDIYEVSSELNYIFRELPDVAKEQFIIESIIEEIFNTNELEGVRSTRQEIAESVRDVNSATKKTSRFDSMVKSYLSLIHGNDSLPIYPKDIRKIYDKITAGEIDSNNLPDGKIFRKEDTWVLKKSGTGKVIHRGVMPEEEISHKIKEMLDFMNNRKEIPTIIKVAIGHYYFGYIHPFYDGNGRTSRFISSVYLSETLGKVSALAVSRGSNEFRKRYLEMFEVANSFKSRGEMNHFIDEFLDIILQTLHSIKNELKEKSHLLEITNKKISNDINLVNQNQRDLVFILSQNHFFNIHKGLTVSELSGPLDLSTTTVRNIAQELVEKSIINKSGIRPAYYHIESEYIEFE